MFKFYIPRRVPERDEEGITGELNYRTSFEIHLALVFDEAISHKLIQFVNISNFIKGEFLIFVSVSQMIHITLLSAIPVVKNVTRDCEFNFSGELLVDMKYNLSSESAQITE